MRAADAGSFSKAAEEAYITPTAVIKQINLLEESLGVKLFDRTHRGLTLTKAGRSLYQDAKYIIHYCQDSVARAKNAMLEDTNVIRVGSSPMTPAQLLMQLWTKVNEVCPDVKFQIVPFENTLENAREILGNLGRNIDIVGGIFDETMLALRGLGAGARAFSVCGVHSSPSGGEGSSAAFRSVRRKSDADAPGLEPLCRSASG